MESADLAQVESETLGEFARLMDADSSSQPRSSGIRQGSSGRLNLKANGTKNGLGQLVLTLVKVLHELLERQAIRRIEAGSLNDRQIERLGLTLMKQSQEIERLRKEFNLEDEDLNLDLGPLGKLL